MSAETDFEARFKLAEALAAGASVSAAARKAGYQRQHVYRLKKDPEFVKMLEAAEKRLVSGPGPVVTDDDARAAKNYLLDVVEGRKEGDSNTVNAAKALLSAAQVTKRVPPKRETAPEEAKPAPAKPSGKVVDLAKWRKDA